LLRRDNHYAASIFNSQLKKTRAFNPLRSSAATRRVAGDNIPGQEYRNKFAPAGTIEFIANIGS